MSTGVIVACIPAYNEEMAIASVITRTRKFVDHIIVCDDGSKDNTAEIAESLGATVIRHETNLGKGAALRCALREALKHNSDYIVTIDADGQHVPEEIPYLLMPLESGETDIVIGSRYLNMHQETPLYRKFGLGVIDRFFKNGINHDISDSQSGFRAFTREAVLSLLDTEANGFGMETEMLMMATRKQLRIKEVPVNIIYKNLGKTSKKHPLNHGAEIISTILNLVVTERPLLMLGAPGIIALCVGLFSVGMFVYYYNLNKYVSVPFAIIGMAGIILGSLFVLIGVVLYAINKINKNNQQHRLKL